MGTAIDYWVCQPCGARFMRAVEHAAHRLTCPAARAADLDHRLTDQVLSDVAAAYEVSGPAGARLILIEALTK